MITPSSPVPAVDRIEFPGGMYLDEDNEIHAADHEHLADVRFYPHCREKFAAAMSPTPGRAAEPDTMAEVERLARAVGTAAWNSAMASEHADNDDEEVVRGAALDARLSAVRTIVTERDAFTADRDEWKSNYESLFESRDLRVAALSARAETAEAQLATLRAEVEVLRRLSEKATGGKDLTGPSALWQASGRYIGTRNHLSCIGEVRDENGNWSDTAKSKGDAAFISAAVNFVRTLLSTSGADR